MSHRARSRLSVVPRSLTSASTLILLSILTSGACGRLGSGSRSGAEEKPRAATPSSVAPGVIAQDSHCANSSCGATVSLTDTSSWECALAAEAVVRGATGRERTLWSKETKKAPFGGTAAKTVDLRFDEALALLPAEEAPHELLRLTGQWLARCEAPESEAARSGVTPRVDAQTFYSLGDVKGWTTQALYATREIPCVDSPAVPASPVRRLPSGTALWVNRLARDFYFTDPKDTPWVYVSVPSAGYSCYVAARRSDLAFVDPALPPPFVPYEVACTQDFLVETGERIRLAFETRVVEKERVLTYAFLTADGAVSWDRTRASMYVKGTIFDAFGSIVKDQPTPNLLNSERVPKLPEGASVSLESVGHIFRGWSGLGWTEIDARRFYFVLQDGAVQGTRRILPRLQMILSREDEGYPPLLAEPTTCEKKP